MGFDAHANFAYSLVAVAPSPASTGLSLVVNAGDGVKFPSPPFNCTIQNITGEQEIVRVIAINQISGNNGDTLTIVRAQEGTSAISVTQGATIANTISVKVLTDIENSINTLQNTPPSQVYAGVGVNYKNAPINWQVDSAYFRNIGLRIIRTDAANIGFPWTAGAAGFQVSNARQCAKVFTDSGFSVDYGFAGINGMGNFGGGGLTATLFSNYCSSVVAEATYLVSQGISPAAFSLGNELEGFIDGTTLTITSLNAGLRTLAASVQAITGWKSPITYHCTNHSVGGISPYTDWINNGLGTLDHLNIHEYGSINIGAQSVSFTSLMVNLTSMVAAFGNKVYLGEFNLDSNNSNLIALGQSASASAMATLISIILASGIGRFLVYTYVEYQNNFPSELGFAQRYPTNTFNATWSSFFVPNQYIGV